MPGQCRHQRGDKVRRGHAPAARDAEKLRGAARHRGEGAPVSVPAATSSPTSRRAPSRRSCTCEGGRPRRRAGPRQSVHARDYNGGSRCALPAGSGGRGPLRRYLRGRA
eukprot:7281279-Pyramimonas_sp.AAC.1